jgi:hypothetical protein
MESKAIRMLDQFESQATSRVAAPTEGRQKITGAGNVKKDHRETRRNRQVAKKV